MRIAQPISTNDIRITQAVRFVVGNSATRSGDSDWGERRLTSSLSIVGSSCRSMGILLTDGYSDYLPYRHRRPRLGRWSTKTQPRAAVPQISKLIKVYRSKQK